MRIGTYAAQAQQFIIQTTTYALTLIKKKIEAVWNHIAQAYLESSKTVEPLILPAHPIKNSYPKASKYQDWPSFMNYAAFGRWGSKESLEKYATVAEPEHKETQLHAAALNFNGTPLISLSNSYNHSDVRRVIFRLVANNAEVDAEDIRGQTPAYWAAYKGNVRALTLLASYGADLHKIDKRGKSLVRAAAKYGHADAITFLASHKVSLNTTDGRSMTPLHVAAYNGQFLAYQTLIFLGADESIKDKQGLTPQDYLKKRYAEKYHNMWFLFRLFSSPNPPQYMLKPYNVTNLNEKAKQI